MRYFFHSFKIKGECFYFVFVFLRLNLNGKCNYYLSLSQKNILEFSYFN